MGRCLVLIRMHQQSCRRCPWDLMFWGGGGIAETPGCCAQGPSRVGPKEVTAAVRSLQRAHRERLWELGTSRLEKRGSEQDPEQPELTLRLSHGRAGSQIETHNLVYSSSLQFFGKWSAYIYLFPLGEASSVGCHFC